MDLPIIEMEKEAAEKAFKEYRDAVRETSKTKYAAARREYERIDRAVMRGYREIAKGNRLVNLSDAIAQGGVEEIGWQDSRYRGDKWVMQDFTGTFPRLAISRADARHVFCSGVDRDGDVRYYADNGRAKADTVRVWEREQIEGEPQYWPTQACYVPALKMLEDKYVSLLGDKQKKAWALGMDALENWTHGCGTEMGLAALEYWVEMDNNTRNALSHKMTGQEAMAECKKKAQEAADRAWEAIGKA